MGTSLGIGETHHKFGFLVYRGIVVVYKRGLLGGGMFVARIIPFGLSLSIELGVDLLTKIARDSTVEMALSFDRLLTRQEMEAVLPDEVQPLWGAISVYSSQEIAEDNYLARRLVGIPLGGFREGEYKITESEFADELEQLSRIPSYSSRLLERTAAYLKANGVRYYGVVVARSPEDLARLASNPLISAAVIGIITSFP